MKIKKLLLLTYYNHLSSYSLGWQSGYVSACRETLWKRVYQKERKHIELFSL